MTTTASGPPARQTCQGLTAAATAGLACDPAAGFRQTAAALDRHLVDHPELFGKATRALIGQARAALTRIAAAVEVAARADGP